MRHRHVSRFSLLPILLLALAIGALSTACVHTFTPAMMSVAGMNERPARPQQATTRNVTVVQQVTPVSPWVNTAWASPYRQVWMSPAYAPGWSYAYPAPRFHPYARPTLYRNYGTTFHGGAPVQHVGRRVYHRSSTVYRR